MKAIGRGYDWYRPYFYQKYTISNILFYDKNGVVLTSGQGWIEQVNEGGIHVDLPWLYLNVDEIPVKRKVDFNYTGAFLISNGKHFDEIKADLYINIELCDIKFKEYVKEYDCIVKYYEGVDATGQRFVLKENVKYLKENYWLMYHKIEEIGKKLSNVYGIDDRESFEKDIKDLKKYGKKYFDEKEYVEKYTIEDYLKEVE